jgi:hypothetical protein
MPACARLSDTPRLLADHTKRESDEISNGFREIHTFSGIAIKRPLIDAMTGTGNSSVFGTLFRAPDCHTFWRNAARGRVSAQNSQRSVAEFERFSAREFRVILLLSLQDNAGG